MRTTHEETDFHHARRHRQSAVRAALDESGHRGTAVLPARFVRLTGLVRTDPGLVAHTLTGPGLDPAVATALADAEVLITCWGAPPLTAEVLAAAPRLRAVVHAAGTVKHHVTDACWERGITVASAATANALPVAEYTLAAILFAGKGFSALRTATGSCAARTTGTGSWAGRATTAVRSASSARPGSAAG